MHIAAECGLSDSELPASLASDSDAVEVRFQAEHARRMGITGVPVFIFNRKLVLAGAHTPETLLRAIRQSLAG